MYTFMTWLSHQWVEGMVEELQERGIRMGKYKSTRDGYK